MLFVGSLCEYPRAGIDWCRSGQTPFPWDTPSSAVYSVVFSAWLLLYPEPEPIMGLNHSIKPSNTRICHVESLLRFLELQIYLLIISCLTCGRSMFSTITNCLKNTEHTVTTYQLIWKEVQDLLSSTVWKGKLNVINFWRRYQDIGGKKIRSIQIWWEKAHCEL